MAEPLKVGLAGLGTVGSAVVHLLEQGRDKLIARCGRPIEIVAISARSRGKKRDFDPRKFAGSSIRWRWRAIRQSMCLSKSSAAPAIPPSVRSRPRWRRASRW